MTEIEKRIVNTANIYKYFWNCPKCGIEVSSSQYPYTQSYSICNDCRRLVEAQKKAEAKKRFDDWKQKCKLDLIGATIFDIDFADQIDFITGIYVELSDGTTKLLEAYTDEYDEYCDSLIEVI